MDFRELTEFLRDFAGYIISALVVVLIFTFVVAFQPIAGNSMHPTLQEGNVVLASRIYGDIKRNEIVAVFDDDGKSYVKRVIGLPGEKVEYMNGVLYINNKAYKETFLSSKTVTSNFLFEDICSLDKCPDGVIPKDEYLLLGDNREESVDSRTPEFGLRSKTDIKGKIFFRVWPLNEIGSVK